MKDNHTKGKNVTKKGSKGKKKSKRRLRMSKRGLMTIAVMLLSILLVVFISVNSSLNKNNVTRVATRLRANLNKSVSDVEKNTKLKLFQSASSDLLCNLQSYDYVIEPSSTVKILGTTLPKWIVYVKTNKSELTTQYTVYNFETLESNILGVSVSDHIDTDSLVGLSEEKLINTIGFRPYISQYMLDGTKQLIFRYNYKNGSKRVCVQLTFEFDASDLSIKADETEVDYLNNLLIIQADEDSSKLSKLDDVVIGTS
jgi:hypothetical protein